MLGLSALLCTRRASLIASGFFTVKTRVPDSPYYMISPSGRIPYLVSGDGVGMEDSRLIAEYLDQLDGKPTLTHPPSLGDWEYGRLEACARSLLDGLAVLVRELRRPENERSPATIEHEWGRSRRMGDLWETQVGHPFMQSHFNMVQIIVISAVLMRDHFPEVDLLNSRPHLDEWSDRLVQHPSVKATRQVPKT
jgi:glutathione S-transferase